MEATVLGLCRGLVAVHTLDALLACAGKIRRLGSNKSRSHRSLTTSDTTNQAAPAKILIGLYIEGLRG